MKTRGTHSVLPTLLASLLSSAPVVASAAFLLAAPMATADSSEDRAIERAFRDVLGRVPSDQELRRYRDRMRRDNWTEVDVRDDLRGKRRDQARDSRGRPEDADRMVRRAYQDILHREPDSAGLRLYRGRIIDEGWSEQDVREALRKSPEKASMTQKRAQEIVNRAYRSVLGRDADAGSRGYVDKVLNEQWTEADVSRELRKSAEYRNKSR